MIRSISAFLGAFAAMLLGGCQCGGSDACTTAGCANGLDLETTVMAPAGKLRGSRWTICVNDKCSLSGVSDDPNDAGVAYSGIFGGEDPLATFDFGRIALAPDARADTWHLALSATTDVNVQLHDGDRWRVTAVDDTGATLFQYDKSLDYARYYPNGARCGPECFRAQVTE